jgi:hypothetical protein
MVVPWMCSEYVQTPPNAPGERRPTGTESRMETEPALWAVRSTGLLDGAVMPAVTEE